MNPRTCRKILKQAIHRIEAERRDERPGIPPKEDLFRGDHEVGEVLDLLNATEDYAVKEYLARMKIDRNEN